MKLISVFAQDRIRELLEDNRPFEAIRRVELALGVSAEVARDIVDAIRLDKPHARVESVVTT